MLTELNNYIIFLPFISVFLSSILFLLVQLLFSKKYLLNLLISLFFSFLFILSIIYISFDNLTNQQIFYLIFSYLCVSFIFMSLIQLAISSLQLTILRMIDLNPGISKKEILKKYNSSHIFEERIKRLVNTDIIYKKNSSYFLKDVKILMYLKFLIILKKIFNIKN